MADPCTGRGAADHTAGVTSVCFGDCVYFSPSQMGVELFTGSYDERVRCFRLEAPVREEDEAGLKLLSEVL